MQNSYLYHMIFIIGLVFINSLSSPIYARVNQKRGELLGGGGTNFSDRKKDQNGLLTGTHSEVRHLFGIYTEGAYSTTLFTNPDICTAPLGYAYGGGFCYDFGAPQNKVCHCIQCFSIYLQSSDGTKCHDLCFLNVEL